MGALETAQRALAAIAPIIDTLERELDPSRLAVECLGFNRRGVPENGVYTEEAISLWQQAVEENADDLVSLHHLAICHHACAIDLEVGDTPEAADLHWEKSLDCWRRIWQSDRFWERFASEAVGDEGERLAAAVREALPTQLLSLHYDILMDPSTSEERAARHMAFARQSGFAPEVLAAIRERSFNQWMQEISADVWESDAEADLNQCIAHMGQYLARDADCRDAMEEALRLLTRRNYQWHLATAGAEPSVRTRLFSDTADSVDDWERHITPLFRGDAAPDDALRVQLGRFYFLAAVANEFLAREDIMFKQLAIVREWGLPQEKENALGLTAKVYNGRGERAADRRDWTAAMTAWKEAAELQPNNSVYQFNLFQCHWVSGEKFAAVRFLDAALGIAGIQERAEITGAVQSMGIQDEVERIRRGG